MTTIKYFEIPCTEYGGFIGNVYHPHKIIEIINMYADENNLEIISISTYENKGIYVVFKEKSNI